MGQQQLEHQQYGISDGIGISGAISNDFRRWNCQPDTEADENTKANQNAETDQNTETGCDGKTEGRYVSEKYIG